VTARAELPTRVLAAGLAASVLSMGILAGVDPALAIGVTLGLVLLIIAMANLAAGICVFTVLSFVDTLLPADAQGTLTASKLMGLVLVLSWFAFVTAGDREQRERIFTPPGFLFVLIAFVGWATISAAWAEDPGAALESVSRYLPNAFLFLIVFAGVRTRDQLTWVVGSFVAGALLTGLYGMFSGTAPDDAGRLEGAGGDANETAAVLVAGGALAAALAVSLKGKPVLRVAAAIVVPLCVFAVFLTLSRGGLLALGAALLAAVVFAGRQRGTVIAAGTAVLVVTVLYFGVFAPAEARERITIADGGTGRVDIWTVGWRMVESAPILGVGAGNFTVSSIHYLLEPGALLRDDFIVDTPKVAHNIYLQVLAELGVVGLVLFGSVVLFSLVCAWRAADTARLGGDRQLEILSRGLAVALVGLLAAYFFVSSEYSKQLWLLLALCPAALAASRAELAARRA
jgi:O-antigen ligase